MLCSSVAYRGIVQIVAHMSKLRRTASPSSQLHFGLAIQCKDIVPLQHWPRQRTPDRLSNKTSEFRRNPSSDRIAQCGATLSGAAVEANSPGTPATPRVEELSGTLRCIPSAKGAPTSNYFTGSPSFPESKACKQQRERLGQADSYRLPAAARRPADTKISSKHASASDGCGRPAGQ